MTTIADIRDRIRKDLHDTDAADYRWPDTQLDRHIEHALEEVSLAIPRELTVLVPTTAGSADVSLTSLEGLIEIERAEYPAGQFPVCVAPFTRWGETLSLVLESLPAGDDVRLSYTARHTLDASGSTLAPFLEDLVVTGAGAYAVLEQAAFTADVLTTGANVSERYEGWARARLIAFRQLLFQYGRNNRVRTRVLRAAR